MAAVIRATGRVILAAMVVAASLGCQDIAFVSTLQKVVNGQKWVQVTNNAAWSPRRQFALLSFNGKLWLVGGRGAATSTFYSDVWSSTDGANWTLATANTGWTPRSDQGGVVFAGKMWVMGGQDSIGLLNEVYSSSDGVNWIQAATPSWSARDDFVCVVFNNQMWVIDGNGSSDDAWCSSDGSSWNLAQATVPLLGYVNPGGGVFNGRIWLMGGADSTQCYNAVTSSADGTNWAASASAPWSPRYPKVAVYNSSIWVLGGGEYSNSGVTNDVWLTPDGTTWTQSDAPVPWAKRRGHLCVAFANKLWMMGGFDGTGSCYNDVWSFGR